MADRRQFLAGIGTGVAASIAGCSDVEQAIFGGGSPVATAEAWRTVRGTPQGTGASSTGGPGPDAEQSLEISFRNGLVSRLIGPIIGADAVYEITRRSDPYDHDPPTDRMYAHAHSREDGSERWRETVLEVQEEINFSRELTAGLGPDHLYAVREVRSDGTRNTELYALSRDDGSTDWSTTFEETIQRTQPVVHDGTVYMLVGGHLVALDTRDGDERWRQKILWDQLMPTVGEGAVAVHNIDTDEGDTSSQLTVFDAEDGSERWTSQIRNAKYSMPVIADGTAYVTDGGPYGFLEQGFGDLPDRKVYAFDLADGSEQWTHAYDREGTRNEFTAGGTASVTVAGNHVYYALGFPDAKEFVGPQGSPRQIEAVRNVLYRGPNVVALDRSDGSVVWETKVGEQAQVYQPMAADDDYLYARYDGVEILDEDPEIRVIDREDGSVVGSFGPIESIRPFAVGDGDLYTHHEDHVRIWR